jgi:hypothetical protein
LQCLHTFTAQVKGRQWGCAVVDVKVLVVVKVVEVILVVRVPLKVVDAVNVDDRVVIGVEAV